MGGCALVVVGSAAVLGFSDDAWAQLLALATGIAMLTRAQLFRYTAQVAAALAAGLTALVLLGAGLCLDPPRGVLRAAQAGDPAALDLRTVWLAAAIATATALATGIALIVPHAGPHTGSHAGPRAGVTPFWGRFLEIAEGFVLLTLVPLTLAVFDVYARARAMTS